MSSFHVAKDGDRLDKIVLDRYGTLEAFEQVLEANPGLSSILEAGTVVELPDVTIEPKQQESKALW